VSYVDFEQLQAIEADKLSNADEFMNALIEQSNSDDWKA
jgi:hypothetical protein